MIVRKVRNGLQRKGRKTGLIDDDFGPVATTHLQGVVVPVWVFGREAAR